MSPFSVVIPISVDLSEDRTRLLDWTIERYCGFFPNSKIILGQDDSEPFNRARARNHGLATTTTEYVLIADGDTAFDYGAIVTGLTMLDNGAPWVVPYGEREYYNLTDDFTDSIIEDPTNPIYEPKWEHKIKSWAGLLLCRTEDARFIGYDERFVGWGWEDIAFRVRMDAEIGKHMRVPEGRAMHLWHPRGEDEFNSLTELKNRALFDREYRRRYRWRDERLG